MYVCMYVCGKKSYLWNQDLELEMDVLDDLKSEATEVRYVLCMYVCMHACMYVVQYVFQKNIYIHTL